MTLRPEDDRPAPTGGRQTPALTRRSTQDPGLSRGVVDDPSAVELLVRYDRASEAELATLEADPVSAAILDRLRAVDRFLAAGGLAQDRASFCPAGDEAEDPASRANSRSEERVSPVDLYAFAGGPDAPEPARSKEAIAAYLDAHPRERGWVDSLEGNPPPPVRTGQAPPLLWDRIDADGSVADDSDVGDPDAQHTVEPSSTAVPTPQQQTEPSASLKALPGAPPQRGVFPAWATWTPLAAAALVLAMAIGGSAGRNVFEGGLPSSPVVRSARTTSLLFPRGRLISTPGPGDERRSFASAPLFEVTTIPGASAYRFELRRTGQDPFVDGELVWESSSDAPSVAAAALQPGLYRWTAWAVVDELETSLGSQHVEVVPEDDVATALVERARSVSTHPDDVRADVRELHAAGYYSDARHRARRLPPSAERDAYLGVQ